MAQKNVGLNLLSGVSYIFKTKPCEEQFAKVMDALAAGLPGMVVGGRPRCGKTYAHRWTCMAINKVTGGIPYLEVPCRNEQPPFAGGFFSFLLSMAHHKFPRHSRISDRRDRFTRYLQAEAAKTPYRTIILMLDEAQLLQECHYQWLTNVYNELDKEKVTLFALLIGQESIADQRDAYIASRRNEIVERFMPSYHQFRGLRSAEELKQVLQQYDTQPYPANENVTFTQAFLPKAFDDGFRIESYSDHLWAGFSQTWHNKQRHRSLEVPAQYAIRCVELFLSSRDANQLHPLLDSGIIESLIHRTGFSSIAELS